MNKSECLSKMVAPGTRRAGKWREGVIQILVTSSCDLSCFNCTQGSNLRRVKWAMSPEQFEQACISLKGYFGVVGVFGGNPALSPYFKDYCSIISKHIPKKQCGLWCNHPQGHGKIMRQTFNPGHSNLNVHLSQSAFDEFKKDWPECHPVGLHQDSRHAPVFASMRDLDVPEEKRWELISRCDINQHWSALIGVFRDEVRAWFCEVAGAQAILKQNDPDYPDTGMSVVPDWWKLPMEQFQSQVEAHCHDCGVPLRGYGELAQGSDGVEQTTEFYKDEYLSKKKDRFVDVVTQLQDLRPQGVGKVIDYIQNGHK